MTQVKLNELKFGRTLLCVFMITLITLSWTTVVVRAQEGTIWNLYPPSF
jgi:hypothetical protein